ncbi:MAG TPA: hypothetical protein VHO95_05400, partial [Candidatus Dormibacteraeota bacterium]|nr:hypothetical protein [Candidatus Dormibacteraeota bacterium]
MQLLPAAVAEVEAETEVDLAELRSFIDRLEIVFSKAASRAISRGDYVGTGRTPTAYIGRLCGMSRRAAADRLCVGRNLESLPETTTAVQKREIGYQAASAMCHLREQLGDKWDPENEAMTVDTARRFSVERFHFLCRRARYAADPEGAEKASMEDFERRWLEVEQILD